MFVFHCIVFKSLSFLLLLGKMLSGEEDGLEDDGEKSEVAAGGFSSKT